MSEGLAGLELVTQALDFENFSRWSLKAVPFLTPFQCSSSSLPLPQQLCFWKNLPGKTGAIGFGTNFLLKNISPRRRKFLPIYSVDDLFLQFYSCLPKWARKEKRTRAANKESPLSETQILKSKLSDHLASRLTVLIETCLLVTPLLLW